jgi:hypothetical protein
LIKAIHQWFDVQLRDHVRRADEAILTLQHLTSVKVRLRE